MHGKGIRSVGLKEEIKSCGSQLSEAERTIGRGPFETRVTLDSQEPVEGNVEEADRVRTDCSSKEPEIERGGVAFETKE